MEKTTDDWKRFHNEELHNLYSSSNIIVTIRSRRIRSAGLVARMGEKRNAINFWWQNTNTRPEVQD
jgi:hypothetical protein